MYAEDAVENKLAKVAVKAMVILMPVVFTSVVGLVSWQLREIKAELKEINRKLDEQRRKP